jgi:hypothetical protein
LNRFGPDTKAGVVLAGANRLLRTATSAVGSVCGHLASSGCDAQIRLAVWAGLVLEVYRAQPALVVAAVQARLVQRSLSARWGHQVDMVGVTTDGAPSEIHQHRQTGAATGSGAITVQAVWRPTSFDLVDATLPLLGLAEDTAAGPGLVTPDALDDIASAWCHRLLAVGRPGRGVAWLTEDSDGSRRVEATVRVGAVVAPFVASMLSGAPTQDPSPPALPTLPDVAVLSGAPLLQRRAYLLMTHVAANYVRYRDELLLDWPDLRRMTRGLVNEAAQRCAAVLDADDPVTLYLHAYAAYLEVWDRLRSVPEPAGDPASTELTARLAGSQDMVIEAWRSGRLDPGAAAYLLEIGAAALHGSESRGDGSAGTRAAMKWYWKAILTARGLDTSADLAADVASLSDAQVFHLHHYAAFLGSSGRRNDLRRALALQERVATVRAEVTRREPASFAAKYTAARTAHELATRIAVDLALATPVRERGARTQALEASVRHARAVLADPSTRQLLMRPSSVSATVRAARVVAHALTLAATHGIGVTSDDTAAAIVLIDVAIAGCRAASTSSDTTDVVAELRGYRDTLVSSADGEPALRGA